MSFDSLGLSAYRLRAVTREGYSTPTPIQSKAIPHVLDGRDVLAAAQTGTGKTAAFTLPLLDLLDNGERPKSRQMRALVLTPTRELAAQIGESVATFSKGSKLTSTVIFGGVGPNPQIQKLRGGLDVLVATPGRLLDHAGNGDADLSGVEILVLDEADRMLDMGFIHDIKRILKLLPQNRQTLLFSATFSKDIRQLAGSFLRDPIEVDVAPRNTTAEKVEHAVHHVAGGKENKAPLLINLLQEHGWHQVLVFCRTKHGSNKLSTQLEKAGISSAAIHGNKSQNARTKALAGFKANEITVLVATDIAARGIDIEALPVVINHDLPNVSEDYVHRIGRTARADRDGLALSLVGDDDAPLLRDIEKLIGEKINVIDVPGYTIQPSQHGPAAKPQQRGGGGGRGRGGGGNRGGGGGARNEGSGQRRRRSGGGSGGRGNAGGRSR